MPFLWTLLHEMGSSLRFASELGCDSREIMTRVDQQRVTATLAIP
jgi:hypothetical protein